MTDETLQKATLLKTQIANCNKLLDAFDVSVKTPRHQYVSIIEENKDLYNKLIEIIGEYKCNLVNQFNAL